MGWNADHTSVGTRWRSAPTMREGLAARVTLATVSKSAQAYVLDGGRAYGGEVPVSPVGGQLSFEYRTRAAKCHRLLSRSQNRLAVEGKPFALFLELTLSLSCGYHGPESTWVR